MFQNSTSVYRTAELSLRFVSNHQLNSRKYEISGLNLSLSLRFASNHHPSSSYHCLLGPMQTLHVHWSPPGHVTHHMTPAPPQSPAASPQS